MPNVRATCLTVVIVWWFFLCCGRRQRRRLLEALLRFYERVLGEEEQAAIHEYLQAGGESTAHENPVLNKRRAFGKKASSVFSTRRLPRKTWKASLKPNARRFPTQTSSLRRGRESPRPSTSNLYHIPSGRFEMDIVHLGTYSRVIFW